MSNIFPPSLVRRLNEEYNFEEESYFTKEESLERALIIVDLQNDFLPGGTLAVAEGDKIIPIINNFQKQFDLVIATQDWHPEDHMSFASNHPQRRIMDKVELNGQEQILWPDHCIQGTEGSELSAKLDSHKIELIVRKGINREIDSYSAFFDNGRKKSTGLAGYLIEKGISKVVICGLAADFCVYYTAMDALDLGFEATIFLGGSKAINPEEFEGKLTHFTKKGGKTYPSEITIK